MNRNEQNSHTKKFKKFNKPIDKYTIGEIFCSQCKKDRVLTTEELQFALEYANFLYKKNDCLLECNICGNCYSFTPNPNHYNADPPSSMMHGSSSESRKAS